MPKLDELVREEGNRYSNSRNVPAMETLDSELNQVVSYCNKLNAYAAEIEEKGAKINTGDNKKLLVSNDGLKWEKLTDDYINTISGNKIVDKTLALSKLSGISRDKVLVSDSDNNLLCSLITSKYLDDSVITADKLAANSVITEKLAANSVITEKLAANSVITEKLAANSVITEKIDNGAVTAAKLAEEVAAHMAEKIGRLLDLPKIDFIYTQGGKKKELDKSYNKHILIFPLRAGGEDFDFTIWYGEYIYARSNVTYVVCYSFDNVKASKFEVLTNKAHIVIDIKFGKYD